MHTMDHANGQHKRWAARSSYVRSATRGTLTTLLIAGVVGVCANRVCADGTEILGPPGIQVATGSGIVAAGVGMQTSAVTLRISGGAVANAINLYVPGTEVAQAFLYWSGEGFVVGDDTITVDNGSTLQTVTGTLIGGATYFFSAKPFGAVYLSTYRADVTDLIVPGNNSLLLDGLDFGFSDSGAGLMVLYRDGTVGELQLVDGQDLAFVRFAPPLDTTVPQMFVYPADDRDRAVSLDLFFASVGTGEIRPSLMRVTIDGGAVLEFPNLLASLDGPNWDTVNITATVPAGSTSLTMEVFSVEDGTTRLPASLNWLAASMAIEGFLPCDGVVCDDQDACTSDVCAPETGECVFTPIECADGNACTTDSCDPAIGCVYTDISGTCADDNACTEDTCDPTSGCVHTDISAECVDGNACTADRCDPAVGCIHDDLSSQCVDGNACTADTCDPASGCVYTDISNDCDDANECTSNSCDPASGCVFTDISAECDDNTVCTIDSCDPLLGCTHVDTSAECTDGNACTADTCDPVNGCTYTDISNDCVDGNACTADSCDPLLGCVYEDISGQCVDDNACTADSCDPSRGCVHVDTSADCTDNVACTVDSCDPVSGCTSTPDNTLCDDGDACTDDVCTATGCQYSDNGACQACCIDGTCSELRITDCQASGGRPQGVGSTCLDIVCGYCGNNVVDAGEQCDGSADSACPGACLSNCTCPGDVPTVSTWGLVILSLMLLVLARIRWRTDPASGRQAM